MIIEEVAQAEQEYLPHQGQAGGVDPVGGHHPQGHYLKGHVASPAVTAQLHGQGSIQYPPFPAKPLNVVWEQGQTLSV